MPYFETDELRALPDMADDIRFPDDRLLAAHDWIVSIIERECDTSFIYKQETQQLSGNRTAALLLPASYVVSVDEVTVDSVALTTDEVDALYLEHGVLYQPSGYCWSSATRGNVTVTYTAGFSVTPPPDLKEAAMRAARNWILTSDAWTGKDSRATAINNEYGNIQLVTAGPDRPTGLPDVDATIMAWARRVRVPKVS